MGAVSRRVLGIAPEETSFASPRAWPSPPRRACGPATRPPAPRWRVRSCAAWPSRRRRRWPTAPWPTPTATAGRRRPRTPPAVRDLAPPHPAALLLFPPLLLILFLLFRLVRLFRNVRRLFLLLRRRGSDPMTPPAGFWPASRAYRSW